MARRQRKSPPKVLVECQILGLSHEGRGIAKLNGKTQFVEGALPGERVKAKYIEQKSRFDALKTIEILEPVPERVTPPCAHTERCGGCSLQHMDSEAQIRYKEGVLAEQLSHFGGLKPDEWLPPMQASALAYRSKARLGVRYVRSTSPQSSPSAQATSNIILGFREKTSNRLVDIDHCPVLDPRIGQKLPDIRALLESLTQPEAVTHIEVALGDDDAALVLRHTKALSELDHQALRLFAQQHTLAIYLQPSERDSLYRLWPEQGEPRLHYCLNLEAESSGKDLKALELAFDPSDFTQVNAAINRQMVQRAVDWLELDDGDRVLDLFCGLGNFTLPIATQAKFVVGVEGSEEMVTRGQENAARNGLENVSFHQADLQSDFTKAKWSKSGFDKILIDPPRSGALDVVRHLAKFKASKVVYVSCNPATLARDAGVLIENGYQMRKAGVMDMFPHTTHVESIALFERVKLNRRHKPKSLG